MRNRYIIGFRSTVLSLSIMVIGCSANSKEKSDAAKAPRKGLDSSVVGGGVDSSSNNNAKADATTTTRTEADSSVVEGGVDSNSSNNAKADATTTTRTEPDSSIFEGGMERDIFTVDSEPWGECGPKALSEEIPEEAIRAAEEFARGPNFLATILSSCEPTEEVTFDVFYRNGDIVDSVAKSSEPTDNFIVFYDFYYGHAFCNGVPKATFKIRKEEENWTFAGASGGVSDIYNLDEQFSEREVPTCARGHVLLDGLGRSVVIVTDKEKGTLFYPIGNLYDWGAEYADKDAGDVYFTKEEFLDWYKNNE